MQKNGENMKDRITVDGVDYERVKSADELPYVIVRTYSAGVFAGFLKDRDGKEATLLNARRLWYWEGAASLSQLAESGTSKPDKCKFPEPVSTITVTEAIEILNVTDEGKASIEGVKIWKA